MDQCGSAEYTKNTKAKEVVSDWLTHNLFIIKILLKIQVLGLLAHLSSYITTFPLNAY